MAPDDNGDHASCWFEKNRYSPRIFNKKLTKLDISTVNNKIDFMRALDLFCIRNKKEPPAKSIWEIVLPKDSLPLKECSVVIHAIKCNECGQPLRNQTDLNEHRNLHCRLTDNYESDDNRCGRSNEYKEQMNYIECNNNNDIISAEKIKSDRKHTRRKKGKALAKVTLKIGPEIISKVYCKKKYLNYASTKERATSGAHHGDNCESCNEIRNILHCNKLNADVSEPCEKQLDCDQSSRNNARIRKMVAAIMEHAEFESKARRKLESSNVTKDEKEINETTSKNDDAIVPMIKSGLVAVESLACDDDIQEVLCVTRNVSSAVTSADHRQRSIPRTMKNCEIITIDDDICDNLEDDCVIVDEQSPSNCLKDPEDSYVFHVSNDDDVPSKAPVNPESTQILNEKRKLISSNLPDDENTFKKQKTEHTSYSEINYTQNLRKQMIEKENKTYRMPTIKLSQFALPLRLINF